MKVLVIGSGPIVIGQAAEFDYAGTQACRALREEGHEVVLVNSNPATIMTDPGVADVLYIEPLTPEFLERVILRERPDALLPSLGGQTGLNLATELSDRGVLERNGVRVLGTPLSAIKQAEDRQAFRALMREIQEPVPESWIVESDEELEAVLGVVPYPCIVRPAYTLGGTGGGIARSPEELRETGRRGLRLSMRSQIMVERSLLGWKEVEYEVMRDANGTVLAICNMENFDPMGVHTGDSIVIAPSQTLTDREYHMLRAASLKIISALGIEGGCNVQLAVNPESFDYYVIEVNPRVSRSSALASKATGYPIARVSAKIAVGRRLDEITNDVTGTTKAAFEPALDYVVVKIPRWPFDKFPNADRTLFTQMKATGEVMAMDRTFESAFLKAVRGLEVSAKDLRHPRWEAVTTSEIVAAGLDPRGSDGSSERPTGGSPVADPAELRKRHGAFLPHWTQEGATYAVTYRLADSVPEAKLREWKSAREAIERGVRADNARDIIQERAVLREKVERYLDSSQGSCVLSRPEIADVVEENLKHFDGQKYRLHAYAIMPNHVHVVVEPAPGEELSKILHSWKSFTAHRIHEMFGTSGEFWQAEYYDHLVRSEDDLREQIRYVLENPVRTGGQGRAAPATLGRAARATSDHAAEPTEQGRAARATGTGTDATDDDALRAAISGPTDERLWAICEGLRRGWSVEEVNRLCRVDPWFLRKLDRLVKVERRLVAAAETLGASEPLDALVAEAFLLGYPSPSILSLLGVPAEAANVMRGRTAENDPTGGHVAEALRQRLGFDETRFAFVLAATAEVEAQKVRPVFKMVDTCAGEFESRTPYYYGTFEEEDDALALDQSRINRS